MKIYVNDSLVVVNNKFENKTFIYDRLNRTEFDINDETFSIIEDIKRNNYTKEDIYLKYDANFIEQLFDLNILTTKKQKNINNVKRLSTFNNVRIFVELTDKCNLRCKHCYGSFACSMQNYLDIDDLKRMLDNASKNGVYQLDVTGGEPFLYSYFEELLDYAYNSGMMVRIFTNLTLMNEKFKSMILKYGVKDIVTSVDSCIKEVHEEFRGQKGCFDKTLKAIELLKQEDINISVNTMIGEHNRDHIDELVDFIDKLEVKSVLDVIVPEGRAKELNENIASSAEIIKNIYRKYDSKIDSNAVAISCGIGDRFIYVKSNGNIYICPSLIEDKFMLGNIKKYDTIEIWTKMTKEFSNLGCKYKNSKCGNCNGGCRARALKLNSDINGKDDVYCIINEVGCSK